MSRSCKHKRDLTQNKLRCARGGCRARWVAVDRRSVGAWSAWCRAGAALHLADSSSEKVCAVCSAQLCEGPHSHARKLSTRCAWPAVVRSWEEAHHVTAPSLDCLTITAPSLDSQYCVYSSRTRRRCRRVAWTSYKDVEKDLCQRLCRNSGYLHVWLWLDVLPLNYTVPESKSILQLNNLSSESYF